eukprot:gene3032-2014_t
MLVTLRMFIVRFQTGVLVSKCCGCYSCDKRLVFDSFNLNFGVYSLCLMCGEFYIALTLTSMGFGACLMFWVFTGLRFYTYFVLLIGVGVYAEFNDVGRSFLDSVVFDYRCDYLHVCVALLVYVVVVACGLMLVTYTILMLVGVAWLALHFDFMLVLVMTE